MKHYWFLLIVLLMSVVGCKQEDNPATLEVGRSARTTPLTSVTPEPNTLTIATAERILAPVEGISPTTGIAYLDNGSFYLAYFDNAPSRVLVEGVEYRARIGNRVVFQSIENTNLHIADLTTGEVNRIELIQAEDNIALIENWSPDKQWFTMRHIPRLDPTASPTPLMPYGGLTLINLDGTIIDLPTRNNDDLNSVAFDNTLWLADNTLLVYSNPPINNTERLSGEGLWHIDPITNAIVELETTMSIGLQITSYAYVGSSGLARATLQGALDAYNMGFQLADPIAPLTPSRSSSSDGTYYIEAASGQGRSPCVGMSLVRKPDGGAAFIPESIYSDTSTIAHSSPVLYADTAVVFLRYYNPACDGTITQQDLIWVPLDGAPVEVLYQQVANDFATCCQLIDHSSDARYSVWVSGGVDTSLIMLTDLSTQTTIPILTLALTDAGRPTYLYWIE